MKLGLLTASLPDESLTGVAERAKAAGLEALEVAAWPPGSQAPSHVDATHPAGQGTEWVRSEIARHGCTLSALAYYDNPLHPDPDERERVHRHLRACITAAGRLGGAPVGTFIGRDPTRTVAENLAEAERIFPPLVEQATEQGVRLMIENCPKHDWHPDGLPGNLAYSPELWEWLFDLGLYLNYDPSHLPGLGIDPVAALHPYVGRVAHVQAKDAEVLVERRGRYGYPGPVVERDEPGWWRYRVPGLGEIDWKHVIDTLREGDYGGVISIELEDPTRGDTPGDVQAELDIACRTLRPLVAA
ncbi:sugar phosphate isomerase/epimerase [Halopolyspora algeriensis]|uniref:Sugar phosphate isomerase/epimerase n=1 Tax=Halopolyspora algeriensis TaxID=1500506 RepID=A0A368VRF9_9ACTN|nr:sugar phosphate isomerase/epimerase [Halopolyspora algeriensis]RCW44500.1 sugar phosphate isomerase/epimerase [Halopolyspora algeriensis]TQM55860.1 sugar phosphate isomerase/epimerase [Halopolyspora algeriensis]